MSPYLAGGMLLAFVAWSGFMYYEGGSKETAVCKGADAQHDLAQSNVIVSAEQGVIATIGQQQTVTQGVDNAYQAKKNAIDDLYGAAGDGVRTSGVATGHSMPTAGNTASRPNAAASRPFRTNGFRLSAQECDENTAQLYGLQAWVKGQQAVSKPEGQ